MELTPFRAALSVGVQAVMAGHLLLPALDPDLPATLSRRILTDLLRDELGFAGVVVTDAVEMRGVADRYGFTGAAVRALAAGADAVCVGGEHADEDAARRLRDAIAAGVAAGEPPEERLVEAAKRVDQLATTAARQAGRTARPVAGSGSAVGFAAARRAVRVTTERAGLGALPLAGPAHVVEFAPPRNLAIGTETPWGVAVPLAALLPGTTAVRFAEAEVPSDLTAEAGGRHLVLVVRDLHRHPWMRAAVTRALADRPDAVVVELGVPELVTGAVHIATHGATRAGSRAAAEFLTGIG